MLWIMKKGEAKQLTRNFNSREFDCKGSTCKCSTTRLDTKLVRKLQVLRRWLGGKSITVNSGNRCAKHNAAVGGASNSYHLNTRGQAADIRVSGVSPRELAKKCEALGFAGIGMYDGPQGRFVHADTRGTKYYWTKTGTKAVGVKTHGGKKENCPYIMYTNRTYRKGDNGSKIRAIQWFLNWAGYNCGVIDGYYGDKTRTAVISFQEDMLLTPDGIVGPATLTAIKEVMS